MTPEPREESSTAAPGTDRPASAETFQGAGAPATDTEHQRVSTDGGWRPSGRGSDQPGEAAARPPSLLGHPLRLALGLLVVGYALGAVLAVPGISEGASRRLLVAFASFAVLGGVVVAGRRLWTTVEQARPADVEFRGDVVVPGTEFDTHLTRAIHGLGGTRTLARQAIDERLLEVAASVVARAERIPLEEARERVAAGSWTADDAEAFLAGELSISSTVDWLRQRIGAESRLSRAVDDTVDALATRTPGIALADRPRERDVPTVTDTTGLDRSAADRGTNRWLGVTGLALLAIGFGASAGLGGSPPSLLVGAAAIVGAAGYSYLGSIPDLEVRVDRELRPADADPGDQVAVSLTVANAGATTLPDLRIVDGVPAALRVVEGTPRVAAALRPGQSVSVSYAVEAVRGAHEFDPVQVIARDASGAIERERHVAADEASVLACGLELGADVEVPVHPQTARQVGRVVADSGGAGLEFHSVREYRRGDPLGRIDWNRLARAGELATLQFREEHAATVVLLVDARKEAYVTSRVDGPSALEWNREAADVVLSSLIAAGDAVGLAALSPRWCWLEPRGGTTQQARARRLLERHEAFTGRRPAASFHGNVEQRQLRKELPSDAQLVLFSPLCDDGAVAIARDLHARNYPVTVVSPDATGRATTGQRLAALERAVRVSVLRDAGVRVVDWDTDRPLATAIEAATRRWSA